MQNVAALEVDPRGWLWVADSGNLLSSQNPGWLELSNTEDSKTRVSKLKINCLK